MRQPPFPSTSPGSSSPLCTLSIAKEITQHIAFLELKFAPRRSLGNGDADGGEWLAACYRLTPRVERTAHGIFLDLGICADAEAIAVLVPLIERLVSEGHRVQAGIGSTLTLAQLAALDAQPGESPSVVVPSEAQAFLRTVPVDVLPKLHLQGSIPAEVVTRLHRYGLRTLGHLTRLDEALLRRQFGARVGTILALVAHGEDVRPL